VFKTNDECEWNPSVLGEVGSKTIQRRILRGNHDLLRKVQQRKSRNSRFHARVFLFFTQPALSSRLSHSTQRYASTSPVLHDLWQWNRRRRLHSASKQSVKRLTEKRDRNSLIYAAYKINDCSQRTSVQPIRKLFQRRRMVNWLIVPRPS
jgi:hypothetical protein